MKWFALLFAGLFAGVVVSGVKTVYYAHEHAELVTEVQKLKQQRDKINANWTQLLLEQKMLANDAMIDQVVANGIKLHLPQAEQVVYLD